MFDYKNAEPGDLKAEWKRISDKIGDVQFFTKKELAFLPEALLEGEEVIAFCSGMMDGKTWLISLTNLRIIFLDKGMLYGLKQATIDLEQITSVAGTTGMLSGDIAVGTSGDLPWKIEHVTKVSVDPFVKMVQEQVQKLKKKETGNTPNPTVESDPLDKLEKLSQLMEKGILTPEEFAEQKAKILGS
ncbi:PH domain-containing protein [Gammaproteobacteria bacterium]|nr:PH domain-containing protein [Gammaproteobacteria bacterium]